MVKVGMCSSNRIGKYTGTDQYPTPLTCTDVGLKLWYWYCVQFLQAGHGQASELKPEAFSFIQFSAIWYQIQSIIITYNINSNNICNIDI